MTTLAVRLRLAFAASVLVLAPCSAWPQAATPEQDDRIYTSDLVTRWGRAVTPENAWRSYPRPQMRRERWQNLNGEWDYAIRAKNELTGRNDVLMRIARIIAPVRRASRP